VGIFLDEAGQKLRSGWVIAVFAIVAAGAYATGSIAVTILGLHPAAPLSLDDLNLFFTTMVMLVAAGIATVICVVALKADAGLPRDRAVSDTLIGVAAGAGLVTLAVGIPVVAGQGGLTLYDGALGALALGAFKQALILVPTSVGEELLLRGVVLRQLAAGTRPWIAVALTGGVFGLMHLMNPDATGVAALNVALVGLWFGVLAIRTSLWTAMGAHAAWNWFEGFVLGQPVSGINPGASLFAGTVEASGFFSGGEFGPEASGLTTVLLAVATVACVMWPKKP
jgi:membrane protease YdiL (CAAX protease family)